VPCLLPSCFQVAASRAVKHLQETPSIETEEVPTAAAAAAKAKRGKVSKAEAAAVSAAPHAASAAGGLASADVAEPDADPFQLVHVAANHARALDKLADSILALEQQASDDLLFSRFREAIAVYQLAVAQVSCAPPIDYWL
jgi:hypothetical protein